MQYEKILVCLDLNDDDENNDELLKKAISEKEENPNVSLYSLHVDVNFANMYENLMSSIDFSNIDRTINMESKLKLSKLINKYQKDEKELFEKNLISNDDFEEKIKEIIKQEKINLIIIGHHQGNFFNRIFPTAKKVLDVLNKEQKTDVLVVSFHE